MMNNQNTCAFDVSGLSNMTDSAQAVRQKRVLFSEALRRYFTRLSSNGRASRSEFWWPTSLVCIFACLLEAIGDTTGSTGLGRIAFVFGIFLWWRRMHDVGKSGWWSLVPLYNLYLATLPSEPRENRFGPVPNTEDEIIKQHRVPFPVAIRRFVTCFSVAGRASLSEFWWPMLFICIINCGVESIGGEAASTGFSRVAFVFVIILWWRRMHDIGKSGWWSLVPLYDLYLAAMPSEPSENRFGPIPNTEPIAEDKIWRNIVFAVVAACALLWLFGGHTDGDAPVEAIQRFGRGLRDKDAEMFLSSVCGDGVAMEDLESRRDLANVMFDKMVQDEDMSMFGKMMCDIQVIDRFYEDGGLYVKFVPQDKDLLLECESEGIAGLIAKTVETEYGWKVDVKSIRPILASAEQRTAAQDKKRDNDSMNSLYAARTKGIGIMRAIIEADAERGISGLTSVLPHLSGADGLTEEKGDISSVRFSNSTDYFKTLLDVDNCKCGDWEPFVTGVDIGWLSLCGHEYKSGYYSSQNVDWMVLAGLTDEMPGTFPVFISANIEPSYLTFVAGRKNFANDRRLIPIGREANRYGDAPWWNECVVVVRKNGSVDILKKDECTLKAIFKSNRVDLGSAGVRCLAPQ